MSRFEKVQEYSFTGPLAKPITRFLEDVRLSGRLYNSEGGYLLKIAEAAAENGIANECLTQKLVEAWTAKREFESHKTWANRVIVVRKLAKYMRAHGMEAYVTPLVIPAK